MSTCVKLVTKELSFCKQMNEEVRKDSKIDRKPFQLIFMKNIGEAILMPEINGVINFCPFCGGKVL